MNELTAFHLLLAAVTIGMIDKAASISLPPIPIEASKLDEVQLRYRFADGVIRDDEEHPGIGERQPIR